MGEVWDRVWPYILREVRAPILLMGSNLFGPPPVSYVKHEEERPGDGKSSRKRSALLVRIIAALVALFIVFIIFWVINGMRYVD